MERDDLCPYCMRPSCAGDAITCPRRFDLVAAPLMAAQTIAEVRAAEASRFVVFCGFCFGAGGYRVPCHGCGVVGPIGSQ